MRWAAVGGEEEAVALLGEARDGARIRVVRTTAGWHVGTPKTHERRALYLPSFVADMLPDARRS